MPTSGVPPTRVPALGSAGVPTAYDVVQSLRPRGIPQALLMNPALVGSTLGAGPLAWVGEMARASADLTARLDPAFPPLMVRASNESSLHDLLVELCGGPPAFRSMNEHRLDTLREILARGVTLASLQTITREVQRTWTAALLDHAVTVGAPAGVLREIAVTIGRIADSAIVVYTRNYHAEAGRMANTATVRRGQLVEELLTGREPVDADVVRQLLKIDLSAHHLCVVVRAATEEDAGLPAAAGSEVLATAVRAVGELVADRGLVVHERTAGEWWLWVSGPAPTSPSALRGLVLDDRVRVGVGGAHVGPSGLRRSTVEAREAGRLAARGPAGPVVTYDDVALVSLLSRDQERARWYVETRLGWLASADEQAAVLCETLRVLYRSSMRTARAAERLAVHRNTLMHRIERIEALLGHPITERLTETYCALLLLDVLPPST